MRRDRSRAERVALVEELRQLGLALDRSKELFSLLKANVPCPGDSLDAMVFGAYVEWVEPEQPADEVIDQALAYEPIVTPPPSGFTLPPGRDQGPIEQGTNGGEPR